MTRNDILGEKPLSEMTLDELAFRRNGYHHDVRKAGMANRSVESMSAADAALAGLNEVEAEIKRRLVGTA